MPPRTVRLESVVLCILFISTPHPALARGGSEVKDGGHEVEARQANETDAGSFKGAVPELASPLDAAASRDVELRGISEIAQPASLDQARALVAATAPPTRSPSEEFVLAGEKLSAIDNVLSGTNSFPAAERDALVGQLGASRQTWQERRRTAIEALMEKAAAALSEKSVTWHGRTAEIKLENGDVLALKFARNPDEQTALQREGGLTEKQRFWGGKQALALADEQEAYARINETPGLPGTSFMPYLLLKSASGADHFSYVGDPISQGTQDEKAERIHSALLKSVDQLALAHVNGYVHTSLAPLSHSKSAWMWDYWRWTESSIARPRFGPTSIHNWRSALSFANVRLDGLADFEHLERHDEIQVDLGRPGKPNIVKLNWTDVAGQNLVELSLLLAKAGRANGIRMRQAAQIAEEIFLRHAKLFGLEDRFSIEPRILRRALVSFMRRYYAFDMFEGLLPRFIARSFNRQALSISNIYVFHNSNGRLNQTALEIARTSPLFMPGYIVHPLIMDAVWPYTEALAGRAPDFARRQRWVERAVTKQTSGDLLLNGTVRTGQRGAVRAAIWALLAWLIITCALVVVPWTRTHGTTAFALSMSPFVWIIGRYLKAWLLAARPSALYRRPWVRSER